MTHDLLALADRCEREPPSMELDEAIATALGWNWVGVSPCYWLEPGMDVAAFRRNPDVLHPRVHLATPPHFTTITDAALSLRPTGTWFYCAMGKMTEAEPIYGATIDKAVVGDFESEIGRGESNHTLALAICAAALRAQHAIMQTKAQPDAG